jgi:L-proline 4-hydroxylase
MSLVTPQISDRARLDYDREGWCRLPVRLPAEDVRKVRASIARLSTLDGPEVVYERDSSAVRALHGCHRLDEVCARLVRLPLLVDLAESLLGGPVYVYQFKVNLKQPHEGAAWPWHQDFTFWHHEDGMRRPAAVNVAVHLDDIHAGNGPLRLIPGSHRLGIVDGGAGGGARAARRSGDWRRHVAADLEYTIPESRVRSIAQPVTVRSVTGPTGTVCAFHPSIVHCSSNNASADRRALLLITYNRVDNAPERPVRPEFLVSRDTAPVVRLDAESL